MKKLVFALAVAGALSAARAEYLYWQIDTSESSGLVSETYTGARVFASSDNGVTRNYLNIGYGDYDTGSFQSLGTAVQIPLYDSVAAVIDSTYTEGYSFYIELINYSTWQSNPTASSIDSGAFVAQSADPQTYTQLSQAGYVGADLSPVSMAVWHGGAYTTVPEPTSAVLMLLGFAGLALRRRAV